MKNSIVILILVLLSVLTVWKAEKAILTFTKKNVSVYDGVMAEKNQIRRYHSFDDNFSLGNRYSQAYYEFIGNPVGGAYDALVTFVCPSCLISSKDLLLRAFLVLFIFGSVCYYFLPIVIPKHHRLLFIIVLYQLPLFYHFRYGLATHITEILSTLLTISAFFLMLKYQKSKKEVFLCVSLVLVFIVISLRLNFFVYIVLLFAFFIPDVIKNWMSNFSLKKILSITPSLLVLVLIAGYFLFNYEGFMGYNNKPVAYGDTSFISSFSTFINDFISQLFFLGIITFITLSFYFSIFIDTKTSYKNTFITSNKLILNILFVFILSTFIIHLIYPDKLNNIIILITLLYFIVILFSSALYMKQKKILLNNNFYSAYPFLFFFFYILIVNQSTNNPHLSTVLSLSFMFLVFPLAALLGKIKVLKNLTSPIVKKSSLFVVVLLVIGLNGSFVNTLSRYEAQREELRLTNYVADAIISKIKDGEYKHPFNYMVFYDAMQEVPIDVRIFKETGVWMNSKGLFAVNDWNYYNISETLSTDELIQHYIRLIEEKSPLFLVIGPELRENLRKKHKNAVVVQSALFDFIETHPDYSVIDEFYSDYEGKVFVFERQ